MTGPARPRRGPRTLRGRLSLAALTCAASVMVLLTVVCNLVVRHHLQRQADDELRTRVTAVAATVDTRRTPVRVLETADDAPLDTNVWIYAGPRLLEHPAAAPAGSPLGHAAARLAAHGDRRCAVHGAGAPVRLCAAPVGAPAAPGRPVAAVVAALDLGPYRASAATLLWASLALDGVVLAGAYVLTWLAVGRALRPVTEMTDQATRWSAVASPHRLAGAGRPAELTRLGASLDELLDRIRAVLRHEQQLTRELSHELRTPLARITAELDWWRARPRSAAETATVHTHLTDAADAMRAICDTLLDDARATARTTPGTGDAVATLRRLADRLTRPDGPAVTVTGPDTAATGVSGPLLERIVGPLVDNALRYARTAVGIRVGRADGTTTVEVTDDGPGVPPAFAAELFRPGSRADPADGHGGAGLGLPLARRLARAAGGEVDHEAGTPSGARFVVTLPGG
ncbi:sensor histidine kinase [Streptomyces catenulae]|uniref:Signal transduction histidine-protein kinase/phosphatase MprB n=1 Tax=Streptomyces catenulae TaxID=66875 RepID=A0ABV2Z7W3_9ACTN|nr:HAMP domain-containing sensor histidine kinase [Streptomyces catenulae]